jgi:hypothetical protein
VNIFFFGYIPVVRGASMGLLYTSTFQGSTGSGAAYYFHQLGADTQKENDKLHAPISEIILKVGHIGTSPHVVLFFHILKESMMHHLTQCVSKSKYLDIRNSSLKHNQQ